MILALAGFDHNRPQSPRLTPVRRFSFFFIILFRIIIGNLSVATFFPVHMIA